MDDIKILKGNIIYTKTKDEFEICEHGYLVCKDGKVEGIYQTCLLYTSPSPRDS